MSDTSPFSRVHLSSSTMGFLPPGPLRRRARELMDSEDPDVGRSLVIASASRLLTGGPRPPRAHITGVSARVRSDHGDELDT